MSEVNWWGATTGAASEKVKETGPLEVDEGPQEIAEPKIEQITDADQIRAMVAVSRGESELYLIKVPPVSFSMLEIDLAGDIYKIIYQDKIYGYTSNPKIFRESHKN